MNTSAILLLGLATVAVLVTSVTSAALCPHCICPPSYAPVCGVNAERTKLRGFSSPCVLQCTNMCRKSKYTLYYNGRCGKAPPLTTTSTTSQDTPSTTVADQTTKSP